MFRKTLTIICIFVWGVPAKANTDFNLFFQALAECAAFVTDRDFDVLGTYGEAVKSDGKVDAVIYPSLASQDENGAPMVVGVVHSPGTSTSEATWMCSGAGSRAPHWPVLEAFELPKVALIMDAYGLEPIAFPAAQHVFANCSADKNVFALFNAAEGDLTSFAIMENTTAQIYCDTMGTKTMQMASSLPIALPGEKSVKVAEVGSEPALGSTVAGNMNDNVLLLEGTGASVKSASDADTGFATSGDGQIVFEDGQTVLLLSGTEPKIPNLPKIPLVTIESILSSCTQAVRTLDVSNIPQIQAENTFEYKGKLIATIGVEGLGQKTGINFLANADGSGNRRCLINVEFATVADRVQMYDAIKAWVVGQEFLGPDEDATSQLSVKCFARDLLVVKAEYDGDLKLDTTVGFSQNDSMCNS